MTPAAADRIRVAFLAAAEDVIAALGDAAGSNGHERLLTVEQVAEQLAISRTLAYHLVGRGHIRSVTIGRARRVPAAAVTEYISDRTAGR